MFHVIQLVMLKIAIIVCLFHISVQLNSMCTENIVNS